MGNPADDAPVCWRPNAETSRRAQLTGLMTQVGVDTFENLHRWSVEEPDAFWQVAIDDLDIEFATSPAAIRGSSDVTNPEWFPGAELNIVSSCLDHDERATAVISVESGRMLRVTVGELRSLVGEFAAGFSAAGFEPGDRVAIAMPMNLHAVVAYLGIVAAGGVVVSIADSFAADEIRMRLGITDPVAIVTQDEAHRLGRTLPMYRKCVDAGGPPAIVVPTGASIDLRPDDCLWDDFVVRNAAFQSIAMAPGAHTNILFSSGTTGEPKAIPWTHTTPIKAAMDGRYHHDIHAGDVVAWPTNLGWMMGPWLIYAALLNRAALALYEDAPTTRGFVEFVEAAGVTMLGVVPSIVASWRSNGTLEPGDWTTVRVLSSTGEASSPDDYAWLMATAGGVPVIEYCGGTEIGGGYLAGTVLHDAVPSRFTTPALGLDLVILDDEGHPADVGEVFLVPPSIGLSTELLNRDHRREYYERVPTSDRVLRRHGDQIRRFPDGTMQALGRVDDTMNLGGIKVSSAELESAVGDLPGVEELAAIASPPPGGGPDRLVLFVVPAQDASIDLPRLTAQIQGSIRARLNPLFRVHDVVLIEVLPRTASHKIMRRTLREEYTK
ncbi:MAG: AMP-binding protein [Acidimicrobiia bacterium]